ncbi:hypothetical protein BK411_17420 [Vibrio splendidus]|nr:hypothetical protein BK411_17420 [Vibrio splendidus]
MLKNSLLVLLMTCCMSASASWFDSDDVEAVKGAELNACPDVSVEQMVDSFLSSPSWESFTTDGRTFVNIEGGLEFNDKPVDGLIQFELFEDDSLNINAFELNEIAQNHFMTVALVEKMCESAKQTYSVVPKHKSLPNDKVIAQVLSLDMYGEEALKIKTSKGDFIMNSFAMSNEEFQLLEKASSNKAALCFEGEDTSFKDRVSASCF